MRGLQDKTNRTMKKIIYTMLGVFREIRGSFCTFWLKRQLVSYGTNIGAARMPRISRTARVSVGSCVGFNGLIISGLGGG